VSATGLASAVGVVADPCVWVLDAESTKPKVSKRQKKQDVSRSMTKIISL
jgi:hypothetical protein